MNFIGGRCDKKWRFSKWETAFAGVQKFLNGEMFMNFIKRNLLHMATFHEFDLIGERCEKNDDFQKEKPHMEGYKRCHGDDVHENHHFIDGKLIAHGQILISKCYLQMIIFVFN